MRWCLGLLVCALGCSTSPESLCEHTTKLVERQFGYEDPTHKQDSHDRGVKRCTAEWTERRKKDPKAFECYADCAMRTKNIVDLSDCRPKCYPGEQKPADEPEKLQGIFWTEDASPPPSASASK